MQVVEWWGRGLAKVETLKEITLSWFMESQENKNVYDGVTATRPNLGRLTVSRRDTLERYIKSQ